MSNTSDFKIENGVLTEYTGKGGDVVIPDGVIEIGYRAFFGRKDVTGVTIPGSVRTLGQQAFCGCSSIKEIHIPENVEGIGSSCFTGCSSLRYFEALHEGVEVEPNSFGSKLSKRLYYPEYFYLPAPIIGTGVTKLLYAHGYLTSRERFSPELQKINDAVVKKNRSKLLELVLETKNKAAFLNIVPFAVTNNNIDAVLKALRKIGDAEMTAFLLDWQKNNLRPVDPEKKLQKELNRDPMSVGELRKIWNTKKLADGTLGITSYKGSDIDVVIPERIGNAKVTVIRRDAFRADSLSMNGNKITEEQAKARKRIRSVTVPDSITEIEFGAFSRCHIVEVINRSGIDLSKAVMFWENGEIAEHALTVHSGPGSVIDTVDGYGFVKSEGTAYLVVYSGAETSLTLPDFYNGEKYETYHTFAGCEGLKNVTVPSGVTCVGEFTFDDCKDLSSVIILDGVTSIGFNAFFNCDSLTSVTIPDSVTEIDDSAFTFCDVTIHAPAGSYAEQYAKENDIPFKAI